MAGLAPLIGEMLGVERAPIEVVEEGLRHSVRIGDAIDFEVEDIVPFGIETGEPARLVGVFHPVGSELTAAEATRSQIKRLRHRVRGEDGAVGALLVGRLSLDRLGAGARRPAPRASRPLSRRPGRGSG